MISKVMSGLLANPDSFVSPIDNQVTFETFEAVNITTWCQHSNSYCSTTNCNLPNGRYTESANLLADDVDVTPPSANLVTQWASSTYKVEVELYDPYPQSTFRHAYLILLGWNDDPSAKIETNLKTWTDLGSYILAGNLSETFVNSYNNVQIVLEAYDEAGNYSIAESSVRTACSMCGGTGQIKSSHVMLKTSSSKVSNHGEFSCGKCDNKNSGGHWEVHYKCRQCRRENLLVCGSWRLRERNAYDEKLWNV